jgi:aspartate/methionine/tyrosine aminotransferase
VRIAPFGVEQWMNAYETRCRYNLAETCVESLTVRELLELCGKADANLDELLPTKLTYGAIEGSERLRSAIAALHTSQAVGNVLVAHGASGANALVYQGLVEPGDEVVALVPNYQQHYSIAESLGAVVNRLELRAADGYMPDVDALRSLVTPRTKLITLSNPNNPTGALIDRAGLEEIARVADRVGAWVLCDEVYRGTTQVGDALTPSMVDLYSRGISTGSMSKAFSLAGLRLGWMVGPRDVLALAGLHRDYNTISVGMLDDHFAAIALENRDTILARSRRIVRANLAILDAWVSAEPGASHVRPRAGTTTLLKHPQATPSRDFCVQLLEATGVLFTPGSAMDAEGFVRVGYANNEAVLRAGLQLVSGFLRGRC